MNPSQSTLVEQSTQLVQFLAMIKRLTAENMLIFLAKGHSVQDLLNWEMSSTHRANIIEQLSEGHYASGPEPTFIPEYPECWHFRLRHRGQIYALSLALGPASQSACCLRLSRIHPSEAQ